MRGGGEEGVSPEGFEESGAVVMCGDGKEGRKHLGRCKTSLMVTWCQVKS